jgi:hypothetical protein
VLLDRKRFAGEQRLVHEQVVRFEQDTVGGDHGAGAELHDIAGNDLLARQFQGWPSRTTVARTATTA